MRIRPPRVASEPVLLHICRWWPVCPR